PTTEDIDKIIGRADVEVFTPGLIPQALGGSGRRTTAGEAAVKGREIVAHIDPVTGERVPGPPPDDLFVEPDETSVAPAPGAPPQGVDPAKWQRARAIMDPADRDDPEKVRRVMERL